VSIFLDGQPDPAAMLAALRNERIERVLMLEMQFASETVRLTNALLPFTDLKWGYEWQGFGNLVGMDAISGGPDSLAPMRSYTLGIPWQYLTDTERGVNGMGLLPGLIGNRAEYRSRMATLYMQMFSGVDGYGRAMPLGYPFALDVGVMDHLTTTYTKSAAMLRMTVESLTARKGAPVYGLLTYRDQKRRFPTDEGLSFVPEVMSTTITWPRFT
jgi:hypothetical protein